MIFKNKYKEFVRIFLYENGLNYIHIKEDVIVNKYQCEFSRIKNINLPIELIVHHRSMNCNSFITRQLSKKEVVSLINNTIEKNITNNSQFNTIFYSTINGKTSNSNLIQICECDLNKEMLNTFRLLSSNPKVSMTVFPVWVTTNFIKTYCNNTYEFATNIFVIEYLDCWNIIVINDHHIIYNRSGLLNSFQKNIELTNTLNHMKNNYKINIDNIIIYEFGEDTIDSLTKYYKSNMQITSILNKIENNKRDIHFNNIIKIACFSCISINAYFLFSNLYVIHDLLINKISNTHYIDNCNKNIVNDFNIWNNLHNTYYSLKNVNYNKVLESHTDTINSLHMKLDYNNNIICSVNV